MTEVIDKPQAKKEARVIVPQRMALAEQVRQDWVVNAEEGTTIEAVVDPQYWAHTAALLQPFDRIDVRLETGEWMLELLVISAGRNWAKVQILHKYDLEQRTEALPAAQKHRIEWKGPQRKHVVIRIADDQAIHEGFATKVEASTWLTQYENKT